MVPQSQKRRLILCAALLLAALPLSAQFGSGQTDSLVRLLNARYIEQVETDGRMARKAIEPTFLHNGTYLSCDTALWHVEDKIINCFGNVQLLQGESVLTSEKLDYLIDENLAQFRGAVVELRNRQDNDIHAVQCVRLREFNSVYVFNVGPVSHRIGYDRVDPVLPQLVDDIHDLGVSRVRAVFLKCEP